MLEPVIPSLLPGINSEPCLDGSGLQIGIVVARYNWSVTGAMLQRAWNELIRLGVMEHDITLLYVPGSYELALGAQMLLRHQHFAALICFGCIMRGETRHDVVVSDATAQGILQIGLDAHIPVIFGVMCAENQQQAEARIERGRECAHAAIEMARVAEYLEK